MTGVNRDGSPLIVSSIRLECRRHHVRTSRQADGSAPSRVLKCPPSAERAWGLGGLCAASAEYGAARDERSLAQCEVARPRLNKPMCGIAGIMRWNGAAPDQLEIERMTAAIAHRGPDGVGFLRRDNVAPGHRRLAIIDPAGGHQPMPNEDGTLCITHNGEIHNYLELQDQ